MKTPSFWYQDSSIYSPLSVLLTPLAWLYAKAASFHKAHSTPASAPLPVICLGNLVAGGSGKTPTAIALAKLLQNEKVFLSPAFVTRGYRGRVKTTERVDQSNNASLWGDEAVLLARHAPTFVSPNRYLGALAAKSHGADVAILDDGLQNYSLNKNVSFAVIDGQMGFGNERIIPAGPLRQSLEDGFSRVDAFILIGEDLHNLKNRLPADKPVFTARLKVKEPLELPSKGPYIGFCGIGFPDKFKNTLAENGIELSGWHSYADHHPYTIQDLYLLLGEAFEKKSRLITTEKDYVRLPDFQQKGMIDIVPVEIVFNSPEDLLSFICQKTASTSPVS